MMSYLYYPGCSLSGTAREYDLSVRALLKVLGAGLIDIEDWTCCGATAAQAVDSSLALALSARNLALAGRTRSRWEDLDIGGILVPCSACYLNLKSAQADMKADRGALAYAGRVLEREGLTPDTALSVRHLLDVLSRDVDWSGNLALKHPAAVSLSRLIVAPYYGCQCLRPFRAFDNPEAPHSMDGIIRATGARVLDWDMGGACCGASNATTKPAAGRALTQEILSAAREAHCIVTVCPMCHMNLETCQESARPLPILYLPQLLGLALGLPPGDLGLSLNLTDNRQLIGG